MARCRITIRQSILVYKPATTVWDYTQDYDKRHLWDVSVVRAEVIKGPGRVVKLWFRDGSAMTYAYKHYARPGKTTLATRYVKSPFVESAGGSWTYEEKYSVTNWTQVNTVELKPGFITRTFLFFFKWHLSYNTKRAMRRAKKQIEAL